MFKIILGLIFLFIVSCGSLVNDPSISVVDANYPSLEIYQKDNLYNGLAIFEVDPDSNLRDLNLSIQGYYNGEVRIFSSTCNVDDIKRYEGPEKIYLGYNIKIDRVCVFSIVLAVDFPKAGEVVVHPFKGHIVVAPKKKTYSITRAYKIPVGGKRNLAINFGEDATVFFEGCETSTQDFFRANNRGIINIDFTNYFNPSRSIICVPQMAIIGETKKMRVRLVLGFHSSKFVPLAKPSVRLEDNELKINAQNVVSVVSFGKRYSISSIGNFSPKNGNTARIMTNKGRLLVGKYHNGVIIWK